MVNRPVHVKHSAHVALRAGKSCLQAVKADEIVGLQVQKTPGNFFLFFCIFIPVRYQRAPADDTRAVRLFARVVTVHMAQSRARRGQSERGLLPVAFLLTHTKTKPLFLLYSVCFRLSSALLVSALQSGLTLRTPMPAEALCKETRGTRSETNNTKAFEENCYPFRSHQFSLFLFLFLFLCSPDANALTTQSAVESERRIALRKRAGDEGRRCHGQGERGVRCGAKTHKRPLSFSLLSLSFSRIVRSREHCPTSRDEGLWKSVPWWLRRGCGNELRSVKVN